MARRPGVVPRGWDRGNSRVRAKIGDGVRAKTVGTILRAEHAGR
jgi:hypothetical protein